MRTTYYRLLMATAVLLYILIVVSGLARITGSEIGCPGWPLCNGQIIPSLHWSSLLEFSHRLLTLIAGLLLIIAAQFAWSQRHSEPDPWVWRPPLVAAALLVVQALLGTIILWNSFSALFVIVTVGLQTIMLACIIIPAVALVVKDLSGIRTTSQGQAVSDIELSQARSYRNLVLGTALASWLLVLVGATVAGTNSGMACVGFPVCNGEFIPTSGGWAVVIHMTHRALAYVVIALMLWIFATTALKRWRDYVLLQWVLLVGALLMTQATIGGANSLLAMPPLLRALHLAIATAYWGSMVIFTILVLRRPVLSVLDSSGRLVFQPMNSEKLKTEN